MKGGDPALVTLCTQLLAFRPQALRAPAQALGPQLHDLSSNMQQTRPTGASGGNMGTQAGQCRQAAPPALAQAGPLTFCFFSVPFSSGSNRIWNICSTLASVEDMYLTYGKPAELRHHRSGPEAAQSLFVLWLLPGPGSVLGRPGEDVGV